jgi:hypothetical protein
MSTDPQQRLAAARDAVEDSIPDPAGDLVDDLLTAHAAVLAAQIRSAAERTRMAQDRPGLRFAADLIDPARGV